MQVLSYIGIKTENLLLWLSGLYTNFWNFLLMSFYFIITKDHFKQKWLLWPQVPFNEILELPIYNLIAMPMYNVIECNDNMRD